MCLKGICKTINSCNMLHFIPTVMPSMCIWLIMFYVIKNELTNEIYKKYEQWNIITINLDHDQSIYWHIGAELLLMLFECIPGSCFELKFLLEHFNNCVCVYISFRVLMVLNMLCAAYIYSGIFSHLWVFSYNACICVWLVV